MGVGIVAGVDEELPERADHAPAEGERIPSHYRWCFGCGDDHPTGLHMELYAGAGLDTYGTFIVTGDHQGAPGLAHGGLLTTAMDEVLGSLNWLLAKPAVTAHLECDFRRPVPVGSILQMRAQVDGVGAFVADHRLQIARLPRRWAAAGPGP